MRLEQSGLWVIHMLDPKAIIRCTESHVAIEGEIYSHFRFRNADGEIEEWTLSAFHFFTSDFLKEPEEQVKPLLDRAWRWYRAYLEWEDKNIER